MIAETAADVTLVAGIAMEALQVRGPDRLGGLKRRMAENRSPGATLAAVRAECFT
ncbi:MAG TPA: hypothetical protein VF502_18920 [Stellaceae bacterium]